MKRPLPRTRRSDKFEPKADVRFTDAIVSYEVPKKKFSVRDMKNIEPLTRSQESVFDHWEDDMNIMLNGFPGCGKSFLAIALALKEILSGDSPYKKLILTRTAVPTLSQGFLPGTLDEKLEVFEAPYKAICADLFRRSTAYETLKEAGIIEFTSTSYLRSMTFDDSIIVFDEWTSAAYNEVSTVITRLGHNSKIIMCGDENQCDRQNERNFVPSFDKVMRITSMMPTFRTVNFTIEDCVRSGVCKEFLVAEARYNEIVDNKRFDK